MFAHGEGRVLKVLRPGFPDALGEEEVAAWRLPILVARLDDGIEDERAHVRSLIDGELATAER